MGRVLSLLNRGNVNIRIELSNKENVNFPAPVGKNAGLRALKAYTPSCDLNSSAPSAIKQVGREGPRAEPEDCRE